MNVIYFLYLKNVVLIGFVLFLMLFARLNFFLFIGCQMSSNIRIPVTLLTAPAPWALKTNVSVS